MKPTVITLPAKFRERDADRVRAACMEFAPGERVEVTIEVYDKNATAEQNHGVWKLYELIAMDYGDRTARDVMRECKLHHGVPILRRDDAEYRTAYDAAIKPLDYERKLIAMDFWPVTRQMRKWQKSEYLQAVQDQYRVYLERAA